MNRKTSLSQLLSLFLVLPLLIATTLGTLQLTSSTGDSGSLSAEIFSFLRADVYPPADMRADGNLPQGEIESEFLPAIIKILLALMSTVILVVLLVSATLYIIHFGNEEQLTTAKALMKWCIVGVLIIVIAYAVVEGITQLTFTR